MSILDKRNPLAQAVKLALLATVTISTFSVSTLFAAEGEEDEAKDNDKIVITGSRISRADAETALPVTIITREELDRTGDISVAEVLRDLPYATSGSFFGTSGGSWANVANTDLRGLGGGRTLYLIDGVRVAGAATTGAQLANANMIPMSAIEEIHVLREGASSIYGSDAIGGVINIITRKDYDGANFTVFKAEPSQGGAEEQDMKLTFGFANNKTSGIVSFGHSTYGGIKGGEREHLRNPEGEPFNDYAALWYSPYANYRLYDFYDPASGLKPGWNPGPNCPAEQIDTEQSVNSDYCYSNNLAGKDYYPATASDTLFVNVKHELNDEMSVWARASYYANDINTESYNLWYYNTMDGSNPNNPTNGTAWEQTILVLQDLEGVAPRITKYDSTDINFSVGYDWATEMGDLKAYFAHSRNRSDIRTDSYVLEDRMQEMVDAGYYNPFEYAGGPNATQDVLDYFLHTPLRVAISQSETMGIGWSAETNVELPGGNLAYAVGAEYHRESFQDVQDAQTNAGNVLGAYGGNSEGGRTSDAIYAEVILPVLEDLELNISTRRDGYELPDVSAVTSALKISYRPVDGLLIRASYTEGFRAPAVDDLLSGLATSYDTVYDPMTCYPAVDAAMAAGDYSNRADAIAALCDSRQRLRNSGGNPDLDPEDSTQKSIGVVWSPINEFTMGVDYYDIEITNQITYIGAQTVLRLEYDNLLSPFTQCGVQRDSTGEIVQISACTVNTVGIQTSGLDFDFTYKLDLADMGDLNFHLNGSKTFEWSNQQSIIDERYDWAGFNGFPELRYSFTTGWSFDDLFIQLAYNHVGKFKGETPDAPLFEQGDFDAFNTMDLNVSYNTDFGTFSVGARNLTDEMPTLNREEISYPGFDEANHDISGRVLYARYSIDF